MNKTSGPRKTVSNLPESVQQHLNMYALAAGAAGVGVLALAHPAEAKIVYTPVNVVIDRTHPYNLDLNNDGVTDFGIFFTTLDRYRCSFKMLWEKPAARNGAIERSGFAAALSSGARIGKGESFLNRQLIMAKDNLCVSTNYGPWWKVSNRYLGLKFNVHGKVHYGWARLSVFIFGRKGFWRVTLSGYAFETIPGKAIIAGKTHGPADELNQDDFGSGASLTNPIPDTPQPASLGMLALGAQGVPLWRRKESLDATPE
jgi:hypothetical protein